MRLKDVDPLFLFLGAGSLLFAASAMIDPDGYGGDDVIAVDRETLEMYLTAGGGEELSSMARTADGHSLATLSTDQRRELINRYVEEQALYRQARRWGLDEEDIAIRRRLGQSLRFALRADVAEDPSEDVLRRFYARNGVNYIEPAQISFQHLFFDARRAGWDAAQSAASAAMATPLSDWQAMGDRFPYQRTYVDAGAAAIESQLGSEFAKTVFALPTDRKDWQGPIKSELGYHLVRVVHRAEARSQPFAEVRHAVLDDWKRWEQRRRTEAATDRIVDEYELQIAPELKSEIR